MRYFILVAFVFAMGCGDSTSSLDEIVIVGDQKTGFIDPETGVPIENNEPSILEFASEGTRCDGGTAKSFVVLSDRPVSCEQHAQAIDATIGGGSLEGIVVFDRDDLKTSREYCPPDADCEDFEFDVDLEDNAGTWSAVIDGIRQNQRFSLDECDYDNIVPPPAGDTPAREISITEVSMYQAVKIPLVEAGQSVDRLNAPIIAGRPGVLRVFLTPAANWEVRDIKVRLTNGDVVLEEDFRPTSASTETNGESTVNFSFEQGELTTDSDFSVELLEKESCGSFGGTEYDWRAPATGLVSMGAEALNKPLEIVLVPIRYNADGSGRTVDLNESELQRYRDIAYNYYPVDQISVTARAPVDYAGTISPNGAGFGQFLNWCLNLRFSDQINRDVYYYCLVSPATSYRSFCARGCVAGVAPVPSANDWTGRGGIGIAFQGAGEETFVHEIGHALGRLHSPCGGAQGVDPSYPYGGGTIGDWGYSVTGNQLINPNAKDFMGYCEPSWVSDFTYSGIFDRLRSVLGTQSFEVSTEPTVYRTAVLDIDGKLKLGDSRTMTTLPPGDFVKGRWAGSAESADVWVTPIADIDAALITFKDPGHSGASIELPGLGTFSLQE